jgi:hypothetical protein
LSIGCWKAGIGKRSNGHADTVCLAFLGVEEVRPADWAKPKPELGTVIAGADVFRSVAEYFVRGRKTRERCEDAAGPLLAGQAMTDAYNSRFSLDFDAKLPAVTGRCSR